MGYLMKPCRLSPSTRSIPMSQRTTVLIAVGVVLLAGSAWAHHNMTAIFDFNDRVMLSGTLTKVDWRNPHIELVVDAKNGDQMESWSLEGPPQLLPGAGYQPERYRGGSRKGGDCRSQPRKRPFSFRPATGH